MKARAIGTIAIACMMIIAFSAGCFAGHSRGYTSGEKLTETLKVALHLMAHSGKQSCASPSISTRGDLVRQGTAGNDYDVFVILFDYGPGVTGLEYGLIWPAGWGSAATTHCADFAIGSIVNPGDGMSITWTLCQTSPEFMPAAWSWISAATAGEIKLTWLAGSERLMYTDCDFTEFEADSVFFAGIDVEPFEGKWEATEPSTWGGIKAMFR
jgi:hypothetical protein